MKNILFAASEAVPFIKTGGLADVVGALPKYIDSRYFDVRVVLPLYSAIGEKWRASMKYAGHFYMPFHGNDTYVGVMTLEYADVTWYFIDNEEYFTSDTIYQGIPADVGRFSFFSKAALSILPMTGFHPDVIHCNDWQTGLIPVYLRTMFSADPYYSSIRTVITIHNLKFQGIWDMAEMQAITGLPEEVFAPDKLEFRGCGNMLKGGLVYADAITTVSDSYADEICDPYFGEGLDGLLSARRHDLRGIVNGIDTEDFDPSADEALAFRFSAEDFRAAKKKNKKAMQKELGLEEDPKAMMIGMVTRLTAQKGLDLVVYVMEELLRNDHVQFVLLGSGDERYEQAFQYFAGKYPGKLSAWIGYNDALARRIYASSDMFLMPSQFEPCGLSQLIALRYGSVPLVRETGGLRDTVLPYNEYTGEGTGFSFRNFNADEMLMIIRYAESIYFNKKRNWNLIAKAGMCADFSWTRSSVLYQEMYDWMTG